MKKKTEKIIKQTGQVVGGTVSAASMALGVLLIIVGIMLSMTIVLAIIGVPLIIWGVAMLGAGSAGAKAISNDVRRDEDFERKKELLELEHKLKSNKVYDWKCFNCNKEFVIEGDAKKEFDEEGEVEVICPHCSTRVTCS